MVEDFNARIAHLTIDDVWSILTEFAALASPVQATLRATLDNPDSTEDDLREALRIAAQEFGPGILRLRQHQSAMPPDSDEDEPMMSSTRGFSFEAMSDEESFTFPVRSDAEPPKATPDPTRYLNARSTESAVKVGDEFALIVWIGEDQIALGPGTASEKVDIGAATLDLDLFAPDFELVDKRTQKLDVPASGDSNRVRFALRAKREGPGKIELMAWNGSAPVGSVTLAIPIGAPAKSDGETRSEMDMREPEGGEYTLEIRFDEEDRVYHFQLRSDDGTTWPPFESAPLQESRIQVAASLVTALNFEARNLGKLQKDEQFRKLTGLGTMIFHKAVPADLRAALWSRRVQIKRLNILSPGDPMPWELMRITDEKRVAGQFLGESALLMRWRYGAPPLRKVAQGPVLTVAGTDPPAALQEAQRTMTALGGGERLDSIGKLTNKLDAGGFGVLHFAAHNVNVPDDALRSYVPIAGKPFGLADLQMVPDDHYLPSAPLVFMNACTSAGSAMLMTELAGWAQEFLRCGAGAYVGSLWEVRDATSRDFAAAFYDQFAQGAPLGQAMRAARNALPESDPTRYAYSLYGNPQGTR